MADNRIDQQMREQMIEAAQELQQGLTEIVQEEEQFAQVQEADEEELEQAIQEAEEVVNYERDEEAELGQVLEDLREVHQELKNVYSTLSEAEGDERVSPAPGMDVPKLENVLKQFEQDIKNEVSRIENELSEITGEAHQEEEEAAAKQAVQAIGEIRGDVKQAAEAEATLEAMAERYGVQQVERELQNGQGGGQARQLLDRIQGREETMEGLLGDADGILDTEIETTEEEIQELKEVISGDESIEEELASLERNFLPELDQVEKSEEFHEDLQQVYSFIEQVEQELEKIKGHLEEIGEEKEMEVELEQKTEGRVRGVLNSFR
ncbi:MAG: hypothetical protein ABEJ66_02080 [Candidatus Nanohaloarchaea archaeon]